LEQQHHTVTVVAPAADRSGCGMGLSLRRSIAVEQQGDAVFVVDGTPVDCVFLALNQLSIAPVDLVISGINNGANLADDVFYSGTFAGAMQARHMDLPAIALSVTKRHPDHYQTAAHIAVQMSNALPHLKYRSLLAVLNVNVPDLAVGDLRGLKSTLLGERENALVSELLSENGSTSNYQLTATGEFRRVKRSKMQDFEAVEQGFVSITPLSARFADSAHVEDVQTWLDTL
jgi:5'-nucleotidase